MGTEMDLGGWSEDTVGGFFAKSDVLLSKLGGTQVQTGSVSHGQ